MTLIKEVYVIFEGLCLPTQATKIAENGGGLSIDTKLALQHTICKDKVIFLKYTRHWIHDSSGINTYTI